MADEGKETVFGQVNYHANAWLEEKYKDRVPQEAINGLLLSDGFQLALSSGERPKIASYEKAEIESLPYFDRLDTERLCPCPTVTLVEPIKSALVPAGFHMPEIPYAPPFSYLRVFLMQGPCLD